MAGCCGLGLATHPDVRSPRPSLDALRAFFGQTPAWTYFGGHFGGLTLSNDRGDASIAFARGGVDIRAGGASVSLERGRDFRLHERCHLVLWGGCSVCSRLDTMTTLRALFGPHALLGFAGLTGWRVVDAMLGGGFLTKRHFFANLGGRTQDADAAVDAWMRAAQAGWSNSDLEDRFRAVDPAGQEWVLRAGKIERGRRIA